jgi:hypothetical protein
MSDVIAGVRVNGEMLVYIDYDKPVWQNANFEGLSSTPSLEHFMVDGILGSASLALLSKYGISKNYVEKDFWADSAAIQQARELIYQATDLEIAYVHYDEPDSLIIGDLTNFVSKFVFEKVDEETFYQLIKPQY